MKFNYKGRGFVVLTLATMLVVVGTVNYQLSKKSLLETNKELQAYEQAQMDKNSEEVTEESADIEVVDSKASNVEEKLTETKSSMFKPKLLLRV